MEASLALALAGFAALFTLLFLGVPLAFGMASVGAVAFAFLVGVGPSLAMVAQIAFDTVITYSFSVLPLFILMGSFVSKSGLSQELYDAAYAFLGHRRGGLAMATIAACGGFAAVCGSSLAAAATMSKVAMPPMRRYGYADSLATGAIAAGGTLGILIPPSVVLVIYGIMTETDIGKLFIAGIVPGILSITLYIGAISIMTRINPSIGPRGERVNWRGRLHALRAVWGILVLFIIVLGGIYFGVFTPTEAAGIGASGAFLFALARRRLSVRGVIEVLMETAQITSMMFIVLIGAILFSNFLEVSGMPRMIAEWIATLEVAPIVVILVILAIYIGLGCVLESLSMMLLTLPIFYPVAQALGFDLVWFGILVVVVIEIGLITPPIGVNVFMLKAMLPDVPVTSIFRGVAPFIGADFVRLALLLFVPGIVMFLPNLM